MAEERDRAFLGRGWAFPIAAEGGGEIGFAEAEDDIRQSIHLILGTSRGERVMRPDFGAGLRELVFAPLNTTTISLVRHRVEEALVIWEPRIDQIGVEVRTEPQLGRLSIDVRYRVRATNTFYNLVYPFYLLEGETT